MTIGPKDATSITRFIATGLQSLAPNMDEVAISALQDQDVFLSSLVGDVKAQVEKIAESRPTFEEIVEITRQCYVSAALTLNKSKHERLRQVLLNGLGIERRQHEEHTLLMRAVGDFDGGHIELLNAFEQRAGTRAGGAESRVSSPLELAQILELVGRGFLDRHSTNEGFEVGVFLVQQEDMRLRSMIVGISRLGKRLLLHLDQPT